MRPRSCTSSTSLNFNSCFQMTVPMTLPPLSPNPPFHAPLKRCYSRGASAHTLISLIPWHRLVFKLLLCNSHLTSQGEVLLVIDASQDLSPVKSRSPLWHLTVYLDTECVSYRTNVRFFRHPWWADIVPLAHDKRSSTSTVTRLVFGDHQSLQHLPL